jgi:protein-L-isoaspartate O-methyltransferase
MMSLPVMKTFTENLNQLCTDFHDSVKKSEHPAVDKKVQLAAQSLEQFLLAQQFSKAQETTLLKLDDIAKHLIPTQGAYQYYHEDLEHSFATEFVEQSEPQLDFSHPHLRREGLLAGKEAHFANLGEKDRVLVIGSGYFPIQSMVFAGQFDANVNVVEMNPSKKEHASNVIASMDMQPHIQVQDIKQIYALAKKSSVVFVSRDMNDKVPLINSLAEHLRPGTRVMCRTGFGLRAMLYPFVPHKQINGYTQMGVLDAGKTGLQSSLCLLR